MLANSDLALRLFLQLALILTVGRLVGWLARLIQQPQVVGEMIAGILLGPSLFGWVWPAAQGWLFPGQSMSLLFGLSQVGVALYMFLVGVEFHTGLLVGRLRRAFSVSLAGTLVPLALGAGIGYGLASQPGLFGAKAHPNDAALFLGTALAITAFPVLARIIQTRGLAGTPLGTLVLAAGAVSDGAAWCVLAVVLATLDHSWLLAAKAIGGAGAYAALVLTLGPKVFGRLNRQAERGGGVSQPILATTLLLVLLGAWFTDAIGIHPVLGAFLLGAAMPRGVLSRELLRLLEPVTVVLLLPLFFVYSGLNTRLDLVNTPTLWSITVLLLAAACVGKGGACWLAARFHGEEPRAALAVGTLMNARGLMELIIANIGLQRAIIQPPMFSMLVTMAIVTTLLATPAFEWVYGTRARRAGLLGPAV